MLASHALPKPIFWEATDLEYRAKYLILNGAPEEIRTPDPQIRSLVLYPAELRARRVVAIGSRASWQGDGKAGCGR